LKVFGDIQKVVEIRPREGGWLAIRGSEFGDTEKVVEIRPREGGWLAIRGIEFGDTEKVVEIRPREGGWLAIRGIDTDQGVMLAILWAGVLSMYGEATTESLRWFHWTQH
jgi:hypothetical protein